MNEEEIITKFDEQIYRLEEDLESKNDSSGTESSGLRETVYNTDKGKYKKKSATRQYYEALCRKNPIIALLIIGGILGCIISIFVLSDICGSLACWGRQWWWIPLSTLFIGPLGLVFIALILPFLPWILYIAFYVLIHIGS